MSRHERELCDKFDQVCQVIHNWPTQCPDNEEWDIMLKAAHEAFAKDTRTWAALRILYVKQGMLRTVIDLLTTMFTREFCEKYKT